MHPCVGAIFVLLKRSLRLVALNYFMHKWLQIARSLWVLSLFTDYYDHGNTEEVDGKDPRYNGGNSGGRHKCGAGSHRGEC